MANDEFLDEVKQKFIQNINSKRDEIERKFLIKELPDYLWKYESVSIEQFYIALNPEVRIRKINERHLLTFKTDGNLERKEMEIPITKLQFDNLKNMALFEGVYKTRYFIPEDKYICELDIYNNIKNLITVEVEFNSKQEADNFNVPKWFGHEITNIQEFKNKNLAQNGFPQKLKCPKCKGLKINGKCPECIGTFEIDIDKVNLENYNKEISK